MDREKVISEFKDFVKSFSKRKDTYYKGLFVSVLALLKEQEAKCLSKDELNQLQEHEFVWYESFTDLFCMEITGICYSSGKVSYIQFDTPTAYLEKSTENYGKQYRIWTKQPTKEQMSNLKWD